MDEITTEQKGQGKIAKALAAAQGEMHNPAFDSDNPYFKSKYASLAAIRNACIPVLAKHNICLVQFVSASGKEVSCTTTLFHESGESITGPAFTLPATKLDKDGREKPLDAQAIGSACTYARRYSMQSVVGLVGDADDDGNAACEPPKKGTAKSTETKTQMEEAKERFGESQDSLTLAHESDKVSIVSIDKITTRKNSNGALYTLYSGEHTFTTKIEGIAISAKIAKENNLKVRIWSDPNGVITSLDVLDDETGSV